MSLNPKSPYSGITHELRLNIKVEFLGEKKMQSKIAQGLKT